MKKIEITIGAATKEEIVEALGDIAHEVLEGKMEGYAPSNPNARLYYKITTDHEG